MSAPKKTVYVSVVRAPTIETLKNILHGEKLRNRALARKVEAVERIEKLKESIFNPIRGLATIKIR